MENNRRVRVTVCTSSESRSVRGLMTNIEETLASLVKRVDFRQLPYNVDDMNRSQHLRGIDVMLLCHSIENRRLLLTDVEHALYDHFLPMARNSLGENILN